MKWFGRRQSENMEDRRGMSGGKVVVGGGIIGAIILIVNMLMGGDTSQLLDGLQQQDAPAQNRELTAAEKEEGDFVNALLVDNEDVWAKIFSDNNLSFSAPRLILFSDNISTACGDASAASGPFYCPEDKTVYMDMTFFEELKSRYGAKGGDFAVAYVVAHEVGHHIQTLLGTSAKVRQMQENSSETDANKLSVALELQADFYAGVWTHHDQKMKDILEEGDIEEALSAANAVGDDALQKKLQGHVTPDSFTHGTSEQRMYWFMKGFKTGDINQGNTFAELNN